MKIVRESLNEAKVSRVLPEPGSTVTVDEFASSLPPAKGAKRKFEKENGDGWYSYALDTRLHKEDADNLMKIVGEREGIYKYFNTNYMPHHIVIKKVREDTEEVKSNNIYDKMHAKSMGHFEGSFQVAVKYGAPPVTVTSTWSKDTSHSWEDINAFMRY